jgi:hypothetical protein
MTTKNWALIAAAVVLGAISLYLNRDWFAAEEIQISHRSSPRPVPVARQRGAAPETAAPVFFGFNRKLQLTEVKVFPLSAVETNKYPHPIWHLVSDSNSVPVKSFIYGSRIPGMRPAVKGALPEPLQPGVKYQLRIKAGPLAAQHDFEAAPRRR